MTSGFTSTGRLAVAVPRALHRRVLSERRWTRVSLIMGTLLVAIIVVACVATPLLGLPDPDAQNYNAVLQSPSSAHLFGTDAIGRDILSRTLYGGRIDIGVGLLLTAIAVTIGVPAGAIAGFVGGAADSIVMRLADIVLTFPGLILILAVIAIFGPGLTGIIVGAPIVGWAVYARLTRAQMLVIREREYILAARTLGFSRTRIFVRHALPNAWRPALVFSMADIVLNIATLATLSYLGVGVRPPQPEWGAIIAGGQVDIYQAWWVSTLPGVVLVLLGIGFVLIGDALGEIFGEEVTVAG